MWADQRLEAGADALQPMLCFGSISKLLDGLSCPDS